MTYKISGDCTACGQYESECSVDYVSKGDIYIIDRDACIDCSSCADVCPVGVLHQDC